MLEQTEFKNRRKAVFDAMSNDSALVLFTSPHYLRSADQYHRFYPDNDFYYLSGFPEAKAALVMTKSQSEGERYILFNTERNPAEEQWSGIRSGQEGAIQTYGAHAAFPIETLSEQLPALLADKETLYFVWGRHAEHDQLVRQALNSIRRKVRNGSKIPDHFINLESLLHEMRLIKSPKEIDALKEAIRISVNAHKRAMRACKPGMNEYEIKAEMLHEMILSGCSEEAYDPIIAGGKNACILHYIENNQPLKDGELLLIDAGGCYDHYNADLSRTFPVNGRFSPRQRDLYEVVLAAQKAAIHCIKPGIAWNTMSDKAIEIITQGLVDLKLLQGHVADLIEQQAYLPFYMHKIGHWLGMDVHDVGRYKEHGQWRTLQAGMVTTIEPGIYIKEGLNVDPAWWGMGIRIEDNILVTSSGHEELSQDLPRQINDIEMLMNE